MMKKTIQVLLLMSVFVTGHAFAGGRYTGKITQIWAEPTAGNYILISVDSPSPISYSPACASSTVYHFAINITSEIGKAMLSMALTSYAAQNTVRFIGSGACDIHETVESISNIRLQ